MQETTYLHGDLQGPRLLWSSPLYALVAYTTLAGWHIEHSHSFEPPCDQAEEWVEAREVLQAGP